MLAEGRKGVDRGKGGAKGHEDRNKRRKECGRVARVEIVPIKEDIKEQPTSRNLSATATRVLQCTCPVAASW
jgi:hypothetical protein